MRASENLLIALYIDEKQLYPFGSMATCLDPYLYVRSLSIVVPIFATMTQYMYIYHYIYIH